MCIAEQLTPQAHNVGEERALIEYMCDDQSGRAFIHMMRALCKAAGFSRIKIAGQSEHGDEYGDVRPRKASAHPDETKASADAPFARYRVAFSEIKGGRIFLKKCSEMGIATQVEEPGYRIDPVESEAEAVRIEPKLALEAVISVLRLARKHLPATKYVEPLDWEPTAREIAVGCGNSAGDRVVCPMS